MTYDLAFYWHAWLAYVIPGFAVVAVLAVAALVAGRVHRNECPAKHPETGLPCYCKRGHAGQHATFKRVRVDWEDPKP